MADFDGKSRHPISGLTVDVLGGRFSVAELLLDGNQEPETAINTIHDISPDRWLVIVSEEQGNSEDILALINDEFEFDSVAIGTLVNET